MKPYRVALAAILLYATSPGSTASESNTVGERVEKFIEESRAQKTADIAQHGVDTYRVSEPLGSLIAAHISHIFERGYAEEISTSDFSHGHFFVECEASREFPYLTSKPSWVEQFMNSSPYVVYHTREIQSWEGATTPRSILGLSDGTIQPMSADTEDFRKHGTAQGTDNFIAGKEYDALCTPGTKVRIGEQIWSDSPKTRFTILERDDGRYTLPDGTTYDVFF